MAAVTVKTPISDIQFNLTMLNMILLVSITLSNALSSNRNLLSAVSGAYRRTDWLDDAEELNDILEEVKGWKNGQVQTATPWDIDAQLQGLSDKLDVYYQIS